MLCLNSAIAIVVCPGCNHAHAITSTLYTTLCHACVRLPDLWTPELARTCVHVTPSMPHPEHPSIVPFINTHSKSSAVKCIAHRHPITSSEVLQQRIYDPIRNSAFTLPVCEAHISHTIIVTSDYTAP